MTFDPNKMTSDIPEEMRREETIKVLKERLEGDSKDDPFSAVATMACSIMQLLPRAKKDLDLLSKEVGGNYPSGDIVAVGALLAAHYAFGLMILKRDPSTAMTLGMMRVIAERVAPRVAESMTVLWTKELDGSQVVSDDGGIMAIAIHRGEEDKL